MLDIQEISDRLEIQDLLNNYCHAIDDRDWDALDDIFTPDAQIDYSETGGAKGDLAHIKNYLPRALAQFEKTQHLMATTKLKITGDEAQARSICFNPMNVPQHGSGGDGNSDGNGTHTFFVGLWYVDRLVRTEKGWRIKSRHEELSYFHNLPQNFMPVDPNA